MLSRKVVTRSGRGFRGNFPSKKLNRMVQFESLLERDAIAWFDSDLGVVAFQEQPTITYYYDQNGNSKKYYPDFELDLVSNCKVHAEIKPASRIAEKCILMKYQLIAEVYKNRSEYFVLFTDVEIKATPRKSLLEIVENFKLKGDAK